MHKKTILLSLLALLVIGCGDENNTFTPLSGASTTSLTFVGKLFLGADIPDAQVTLRGLDDQVWAQTTTDATGNYMFRGNFPSDFRVVARLASGLEFAREVRASSSQDTFGLINVPSTVVSALSQADPSQSLETVEARAKALLQIPNSESLYFGSESVRFPFSHIAFFARASESGGVENSLRLLISGEGGSGPYLLRRDVLEVSLDGIDSVLADRLQKVRENPHLQRATRRLLSRGLPNPVIGLLGYRSGKSSAFPTNFRAQGSAVESVLGSVGEAIGTAIIGQVTTTATATGYTWVAEQLGGHFGTTVELDEIVQQLDDIQHSIDQLAATLTQDVILSQVMDLNVYKDDIKAIQNSLVQAYDDAKKTDDYFNDMPGLTTLPTEVQTVLTTLSQSSTLDQLINDVSQLQIALTGSTIPTSTTSMEYPPIVVNVDTSGATSSTNIIVELRDSVLHSNGVVVNSDTQKFGNFPVRSSIMLDTILTPFEAYGQSQILGANLIGEAAHSSPSPQIDIPKAQAYADNVARSLLNTRGQLPDYPLSDNYFIDLQNGLMWYMVAQAPAYGEDAQAWAESFKGDDGSTQGWHLPSFDELKTLQLRGGWAASGGDSFDYENTKSGLEQLGFNLDAVTEDADLHFYLMTADWRYDNGVFGSNTWNNNDTIEFELDRDNFTREPVSIEGSDSFKGSFLVCRTIGKTPCIDIDPPTILSGANSGSWPSSFQGQPTEAEEPSVAVFVGFADESFSNGAISLESKWQFNSGDSSYSVGNGTTTATAGTTYERSEQTQSATSTPPTFFLNEQDGSGASFSNYSEDYGQVTNHVNSNETTSVRHVALGLKDGVFPTIFEGALDYSTSEPTQISLSTLQISPRNLTINLETSNATTQQFIAVGFYSDRKTQDLTGAVTWNVADTDGNDVAGALFANDQPGLLKLTKSDGLVNDLVVTANINDTSQNPSSVGDDSTAIRLLLD